jgi:hypothetical protein
MSQIQNTHTIETKRGNNIGFAIINYLTERNIYGKVEILTIDVQRNCRTRTNIAIIATT